MPMVKNVEKKIWDIEGFEVKILSSQGKNLRGDKRDLPQYAYVRKISGESTVNDWKQNRFYISYPGLDVEVLDVVGISVAGNTKLKNVRKTYEDD